MPWANRADSSSLLRPPLFPPAAVARLTGVAAHFPASCQLILEARLAEPAGAVDLSVQIATADEARDLAAAPLPEHLRTFLRQWSEPQGPWAAVSRLWFEFDLGRDLPALPEPMVCARLDQPVATDWLTEALWPALHGQALSTTQRALARRALAELPASAHLLYAFSLRSRPGAAIRLELCFDSHASALGYLTRLAPGQAAALAPVAELLAGLERIHLSFDLGEQVLPRVGLEGSFPRQPAREPRWSELFARLTARGLCLPEVADAALAWPTPRAERSTPFVRGLSHVKVCAGPGLEPEAKVYLTLVPLASSAASASTRAR